MLATAALFACLSFEAQVNTLVKEVIELPNGSCEIVLDINLSRTNDIFLSSGPCPLDIDEVVEKKISVKSCDYEVGGPASGVLSAGEDGKIELN